LNHARARARISSRLLSSQLKQLSNLRGRGRYSATDMTIFFVPQISSARARNGFFHCTQADAQTEREREIDREREKEREREREQSQTKCRLHRRGQNEARNYRREKRLIYSACRARRASNVGVRASLREWNKNKREPEKHGGKTDRKREEGTGEREGAKRNSARLNSRGRRSFLRAAATVVQPLFLVKCSLRRASRKFSPS